MNAQLCSSYACDTVDVVEVNCVNSRAHSTRAPALVELGEEGGGPLWACQRDCLSLESKYQTGREYEYQTRVVCPHFCQSTSAALSAEFRCRSCDDSENEISAGCSGQTIHQQDGFGTPSARKCSGLIARACPSSFHHPSTDYWSYGRQGHRRTPLLIRPGRRR